MCIVQTDAEKGCVVFAWQLNILVKSKYQTIIGLLLNSIWHKPPFFLNNSLKIHSCPGFWKALHALTWNHSVPYKTAYDNTTKILQFKQYWKACSAKVAGQRGSKGPLPAPTLTSSHILFKKANHCKCHYITTFTVKKQKMFLSFPSTLRH